MKFFSIASSSSGNAYIIYNNINEVILIDIGISYSKLTKALDKFNIKKENIKYLLISHLHNDHIKGINVLLKNIHPIIISHKKNINFFNQLNTECIGFDFDDKFNLENICITPIEASHDIPTSSFVFENKNKKIGFISDTGMIRECAYKKLNNVNMLFIESNYSEKHIEKTNYPQNLKNRIKSHKGHLSNQQAYNVVNKVYNDNLKNVIFIHLSKNSNSHEIIFEESINELESKYPNVNFEIAPYDIPSKLYLF